MWSLKSRLSLMNNVDSHLYLCVWLAAAALWQARFCTLDGALHCVSSNCFTVQQYLADMIQLTVHDFISLQITGLPQTVTGRYYHSLSAVMMGPQRVWLIVVGGYDERVQRDVGGVKQWMGVFTDVNSLTVVIELGKQLVLSSTTYYIAIFMQRPNRQN